MGSDLQTGSLAKIKEIVPNQIGENRRWSESLVNGLVALVAGVISDSVGFTHASTDFALIGNQSEYSLPTSYISITRVIFNNGLSDSYEIDPATFNDFDNVNMAWRNDRSSRPQMYTIEGTPGSTDAQIVIYPCLATTDGSTFTIRGVAIGSGDMMDDIQDKAIVPYVLAMLYAWEEIDKALMYWQEASEGVWELRSQYANETMGAL